MVTPVELAGALQALPDESLDALIRFRRAPSGVHTYFDLAEHLLRPEAIGVALEVVSAADLELLSSGSTNGRLEALGLGVNGVAAAPATALAAALPAAIAPATPAPNDAVALEQAVAAAIDAGSVLDAVTTRPLQLRTRGALAATDSRRLAELLRLEVSTVVDTVTLLEASGLLVRTPGALLASGTAAHWASLSLAERWAHLSSGWLQSLPAHEHAWAVQFPESWPVGAVAPLATASTAERIVAVRLLAHRLGLQADAPSSLANCSAETLADQMPEAVAQAYVQPDLSIVVPGPLEASVERRLRTMADAEQRGIASTYRLSRMSISRALAAGDTADHILDFLTALSLTPVPQPVTYLVRDAAASFGSIRVRDLTLDSRQEPNTKASVSAAASVLQQLAVDRALTPLAFRSETPGQLVSRATADIVLDALLHARYPAVLETADGQVVVAAPQYAEQQHVPVSPLVHRLRGTGFDVGESEQVWLERQLELAARDRTPVRVRIAIGTDEREFLLLPLGVKNGRLRARDANSDVERTVPISAITFVSGTHEDSGTQ